MRVPVGQRRQESRRPVAIHGGTAKALDSSGKGDGGSHGGDRRNPAILGGTPVFAGTRVPVRILIEHLEAGDRLDEFLNDYPSVSRGQVVAVLEDAKVILAGDGNEAAA